MAKDEGARIRVRHRYQSIQPSDVDELEPGEDETDEDRGVMKRQRRARGGHAAGGVAKFRADKPRRGLQMGGIGGPPAGLPAPPPNPQAMARAYNPATVGAGIAPPPPANPYAAMGAPPVSLPGGAGLPTAGGVAPRNYYGPMQGPQIPGAPTLPQNPQAMQEQAAYHALRMQNPNMPAFRTLSPTQQAQYGAPAGGAPALPANPYATMGGLPVPGRPPGMARGGRSRDPEILREAKEEGESYEHEWREHGRARGGKTPEKWIQGTGVSKPGHKGRLHRALHVPEGEPIPAGKLSKALHSSNPHMQHMAQFAKNVKR